MTQPPVIYKPGSLKYLWNYLGRSLKEFAAALSPYLGGGTSYKVYSALVTQVGSDDPTAVILENTLDATVIWYRQSQGIYYAESFGTWKTNKTAILASPLPNSPTGAVITRTYSTTEDQVFFEIVKTTLAPMDNSLDNTFVEIRVYN
jgi:hypothetical protein